MPWFLRIRGIGPSQGRIAEIDKAAAGLLLKLAKAGVAGKMLEFTLVHAPVGLKAARLLLVGAGSASNGICATLRKLLAPLFAT